MAVHSVDALDLEQEAVSDSEDKYNDQDFDSTEAHEPRPSLHKVTMLAVGIAVATCSVAGLSMVYLSPGLPHRGQIVPFGNHNQVWLNGDTDDDLDELLDDYGGDFSGDILEEVLGDTEPKELMVTKLAHALQQKWQRKPMQAFNPFMQRHQRWGLWQNFREADKDGNGLLNRTELEYIAERVHRRFRMSAKRYLELFRTESDDGSQVDMKKFKQSVAVLTVFEHADKDSSSLLSIDELYFLSRRLKFRFGITTSKFKELFVDADVNADDMLSSGELQKLLIPIWKQWLPPKMKFFFKMSDRDGNGLIEGQELHALKTELVRKFMVSDETYEQTVAIVFGASTSRLGPEDFKSLLNSLMKRSRFSKFHPGMVLMFKEVDKDNSGIIEGAELQDLASHLQDKFDVGAEAYNGQFHEIAGNSTPTTLDLDKFRKLTAAVLRASPFFRMCPKIVALFKKADQNRNLLIDGAELEFIAGAFRKWFDMDDARYQQIFTRADADADATLNPQEFKNLVLAAKSTQSRHSRWVDHQQDTRLTGEPGWVHQAVQSQVEMIATHY